MSIRFEKARHEDLRRIVEIYNQIIPSRLATADLEPLMTSDREAWFHSFTPTHPLWVIRNDADEIWGWVGLEPFYGRPAYEHTAEVSIYIDQNARHQGLGSQAIQFVIAQLPSLNVTALAAYILSIISQVWVYSKSSALNSGAFCQPLRNLMEKNAI